MEHLECPDCQNAMEHRISFKDNRAYWKCKTCGKELEISDTPTKGPSKKDEIEAIELTDEQQEIVDLGARNVAINATAGSGKSATLIRRALSQQSKQSIFLAFNRDAAYTINERLGHGYGPKRPQPGVSATLHQMGWACLDENHRVRTLSKNDPEQRAEFRQLQKRMRNRIVDEFGRRFSNEYKSKYIESTLLNYMNSCVQNLKQPGSQNPPPGGDWRYVPLAREFLAHCRTYKITSFDFVDLTFEFALLNIYNIESIDDLPLSIPSKDRLPTSFQDIKEILVDEAQDLTPLQWKLVDSIRESLDCSLVVVGDDDQCLVEGSLIRTPRGYLAVENLSEGDLVVAGSGRGQTTTAPIEKIAKRKTKEDVFTIITESGKRVRATGNHILFSDFRGVKNRDAYIVYLMYRKGFGYRVGVTSTSRSYTSTKSRCGLAIRLNHEKGDAAWILDVVGTLVEAIKLESIYSYKYGIPQLVFYPARTMNMKLSESDILEIYAQIDSESAALKLLKDKAMYMEWPHVRPKSMGIYSAYPRSRSVHLSLCGATKSGHFLSLHGLSREMKDDLVTVGIKATKDKKDFWRYRRVSADLSSLHEDIKRIKSVIKNIEVKPQAFLGSEALPWCPASHIKPGMTIAVLDENDNSVVEETVERVDRDTYSGYVYDLNIPEYHNYIADGVFVHNSIYAWRFADIDEFISRCQNPSYKLKPLSKNFRCPPKIISPARRLIEHNKVRVAKNIESNKENEGYVACINTINAQEEAETIAELIESETSGGYSKYKDFAILGRTQASLSIVEYELFKRRIPTNILGRRSVTRKEIKDVIDGMLLIEESRADSIRSFESDSIPALNVLKNLPGIGPATIQAALADQTKDPIEALVGIARGKDGKESATLAYECYKKLRASKRKTLHKKAEAIRDLLFPPGTAVFGNIDEGEFESEDIKGVVEPLISLCQNIKKLDDVITFVLKTDPTEIRNYVTLSTVHKAKGLEWDTVSIVHCCEDIFPHALAKNDGDSEGERRLFYVAMTRAASRLFMFAPELDYSDNERSPSVFLNESGAGDLYKMGWPSSLKIEEASAPQPIEGVSEDRDMIL